MRLNHGAQCAHIRFSSIVPENTDFFSLGVHVATQKPDLLTYQSVAQSPEVGMSRLNASAFAGKGKLKTWKLLQKDASFEQIFKDLGSRHNM